MDTGITPLNKVPMDYRTDSAIKSTDSMLISESNNLVLYLLINRLILYCQHTLILPCVIGNESQVVASPMTSELSTSTILNTKFLTRIILF